MHLVLGSRYQHTVAENVDADAGFLNMGFTASVDYRNVANTTLRQQSIFAQVSAAYFYCILVYFGLNLCIFSAF